MARLLQRLQQLLFWPKQPQIHNKKGGIVMRTLNHILHQSAINSESFNRVLAYITISIIVVALVISLI